MKYTGRSAQWGLFTWRIMASRKKRSENLQKNHYSSPRYKYLTQFKVIVKKSSPKNLSVDCRSTVGRHITDSLPTGYRQLTDRLPTVSQRRKLLRKHSHDVHHQWVSDKTASLWKADVSPRPSLLRDVSRGGTSVTQWRKFHTDDANQCLHNKSDSHGVPKVNLFDFTFLLVDFGKVLCSSVNELQQNSNASAREDYIPQILTVLFEIHRVYIWLLRPFVFYLSFVNN